MDKRKDLRAVQLRLPSSVHAVLKGEADRQERSVTWVVTRIVTDAVKQRQEASHAKQ